MKHSSDISNKEAHLLKTNLIVALSECELSEIGPSGSFGLDLPSASIDERNDSTSVSLGLSRRLQRLIAPIEFPA